MEQNLRHYVEFERGTPYSQSAASEMRQTGAGRARLRQRYLQLYNSDRSREWPAQEESRQVRRARERKLAGKAASLRKKDALRDRNKKSAI